MGVLDKLVGRAPQRIEQGARVQFTDGRGVVKSRRGFHVTVEMDDGRTAIGDIRRWRLENGERPR